MGYQEGNSGIYLTTKGYEFECVGSVETGRGQILDIIKESSSGLGNVLGAERYFRW